MFRAVGNSKVSMQVSVYASCLNVAGQSVGAEQFKEAKEYRKKLTKIAYLCIFFLNIAVILLLEPICK